MALGVSAIGGHFVSDAMIAIEHSECVTGELTVFDALSRDFWCEPVPDQIRSWRPLPVLTWRAIWEIGGGVPWLFHAISLLAHAGVTWALMAMCRSLGWNFQTVRRAGWTFALMAIHVDLVASMVGLGGLLSAFFLLLTVRLALDSRATTPAVACTAALALLSHESGALVVPVMWLALVLRVPSETPPGSRASWRTAGVITLLFGGYLWARSIVLGGIGGGAELGWQVNPMVRLSFVDRSIDAMGMIGRYLQLVLVPGPFSMDYSYNAIPLGSAREWSSVVGGGMAVTAALAGAWHLRKSPTLSWLLLWAVGASVFVSNWLFLLPATFAERMFYGASIPLAALLAYALGSLRQLGALARRSLWTLVVLVGMAQAASSIYHSWSWRYPTALYERSLLAAPDNLKLRRAAARAALRGNRPEAALEHANRATELMPSDATCWGLQGEALDMLGQPEEARRSFLEGMSKDPSAPEVAGPFIRFLRERGQRSLARDAYAAHVRSRGGVAHPDVADPDLSAP